MSARGTRSGRGVHRKGGLRAHPLLDYFPFPDPDGLLDELFPSLDPDGLPDEDEVAFDELLCVGPSGMLIGTVIGP